MILLKKFRGLSAKTAGVDFDYAASIGINTVHALALPSETVPVSAGYIIADTVEYMLNEGRSEFD